jgi:hypothetical protein
MAALALVDQSQPIDFKPENLPWLPPGRFIWRMRHGRAATLKAWLDEAGTQRNQWPPIAAGLFGGSYDRFVQLRAALDSFVARAQGW